MKSKKLAVLVMLMGFGASVFAADGDSLGAGGASGVITNPAITGMVKEMADGTMRMAGGTIEAVQMSPSVSLMPGMPVSPLTAKPLTFNGTTKANVTIEILEGRKSIWSAKTNVLFDGRPVDFGLNRETSFAASDLSTGINVQVTPYRQLNGTMVVGLRISKVDLLSVKKIKVGNVMVDVPLVNRFKLDQNVELMNKSTVLLGFGGAPSSANALEVKLSATKLD
jgi:hypothetical protein